MKTYSLFAIACLLSVAVFSSSAAMLSANDLRPDTPTCKMPQAKRPKLPVNFEHDAPIEITADFNGDGWCDYALGVPYPINSQMSAYTLDQMLILGEASSWKKLPKSLLRSVIELSGFEGNKWPVFRVDLTEVRLVFPKTPGAPYILGLFSGKLDEGMVAIDGFGCRQYVSVHRWDGKVGAFQRVDDATRDVVLKYFYTVLEKPCLSLPHR